MSDEVIEELWRVKDDMARECGYDVARLIADLQARQGQEGERRIVDLHALRSSGEREGSPAGSPWEER